MLGKCGFDPFDLENALFEQIGSAVEDSYNNNLVWKQTT